MARLLKTLYPLNVPNRDDYDSYEEWREGWQKHDSEFNELVKNDEKAEKKGELVGRLFGHPMGDGAAWYIVVKAKPFTLQLVPYSDAYTAPTYVIRGLRPEDL